MSNAVEKLICVSQPSLCLDAPEIFEVHKLAEVIKAFIRAHGPPPDELVTWKIYCLLHVGVPSSTLAAGVDLLGEMPFTTRAVEQGHAVSALLMKYHKLYTSSVMTSRTIVSTVKQLVDGQVSRQVRRICKLRSRLKRLRKSDPSKIHGRHAYLGALLQRARDRTDRHGWHAVRRQVVKGHSRWFSELSPALRKHFTGKAQECVMNDFVEGG